MRRVELDWAAGAQAILRDAPERLFPDPADDAGEAVQTREIEVHAGPVAIHDRFTIEFGKFEAYPMDHFCRLRLKCHGDRHHLVLPDVDAAVDASDAGDERTELELAQATHATVHHVAADFDVAVRHPARFLPSLAATCESVVHQHRMKATG